MSLKSAHCEYGVISQIHLDRLTVMTTGRKRLYHAPDTIEFTHTKRKPTAILEGVVDAGHPLRHSLARINASGAEHAFDESRGSGLRLLATSLKVPSGAEYPAADALVGLQY